MTAPTTKRAPVGYDYSSLNWDFIKMLAEIAHFAGNKYGHPLQYTDSRLVGEASPVNHIPEHLRQYITGEAHDHFTDPRYHLAAIAYNAMMEYYYHSKHGHLVSQLVQE